MAGQGRCRPFSPELAREVWPHLGDLEIPLWGHEAPRGAVWAAQGSRGRSAQRGRAGPGSHGHQSDGVFLGQLGGPSISQPRLPPRGATPALHTLICVRTDSLRAKH